MIPKIIHYCWLSKDPIPEALKTYMDTWKVKLPDYEFMLWNFDRFDINSSIWVKEAFEKKKYAFAADYIRLYSVYNYGGIYLDMDVEVLKTFNPFLNTSLLMGYEESGYLEMAVIGSIKKHPFIKAILNSYERPFINKDGTLNARPMPLVVNDLCKKLNYKLAIGVKPNLLESENINVFPSEFFSPKSWELNKVNSTENTVCIHQFQGSWLSKSRKNTLKVKHFLKSVINFIK